MGSYAHGVTGPLAGNVPWMVWNLLLALVPAVLAVLLFRSGRRPTVGWWLGLGVLLLFLPNAPYVLTDVVHLPHQIRSTPSDEVVLFGLIPQFAILILVGFGAYAFTVLLLERWLLRAGWSRRAVLAVDLAIHLACGVGVFLGRVWRFNSWDLAHRPGEVLKVVVGGLLDPQPRTVTLVLLVSAVFAAGTMLVPRGRRRRAAGVGLTLATGRAGWRCRRRWSGTGRGLRASR